MQVSDKSLIQLSLLFLIEGNLDHDLQLRLVDLREAVFDLALCYNGTITSVFADKEFIHGFQVDLLLLKRFSVAKAHVVIRQLDQPLKVVVLSFLKADSNRLKLDVDRQCGGDFGQGLGGVKLLEFYFELYRLK